MLQQNARASLTEISKKVGVSSPSVAERIQKMEAAGIIKGRVALLNGKKLNLGLTVLFLVVAPLLPRTDVNHRVRMAGSRFMPLEGERVVTGPRTEHAMRESSVPEGAPDRPLVGAS